MSNAYDPTEDEGRKRPAYVHKKEIKVLAIVAVVAIVLLYPVYKSLKTGRDIHLCTANLLAIGKDIESYAAANNDRYPPVYEPDTYANPAFHDNAVATWVTVVEPYKANERTDFVCPSSSDEEMVKNAAGKKGVMSTYGMYGPLSSFPRSSVNSPNETVLVGETSNHGARDTFDPKPFTDKEGKSYPDGFLIGLNSTNFTPLDSRHSDFLLGTFPTRLAFPNTSKGVFKKDEPSRHGSILNFLYADGHIRKLGQDAIGVQRIAGPNSDILGNWAIP